MAQYKKDKIKEQIDQAALKVFAEKGYENTKVSDISDQAKVSIGNIYRYYKKKEDIFYSLKPDDILDGLKAILEKKIIYSKGNESIPSDPSDRFRIINDDFINFMIANKEKFLIMMNGSKGTKFNTTMDNLIQYHIHLVDTHYEGENNVLNQKNQEIIIMIYENLIKMMMEILSLPGSDEEKKELFKILNSYHLFGVVNLFK
jgi:hypothetical protein